MNITTRPPPKEAYPYIWIDQTKPAEEEIAKHDFEHTAMELDVTDTATVNDILREIASDIGPVE